MSTSIATPTIQQILQTCYWEATKKDGFIDFIQRVRGPKADDSGKYTIKKTDLRSLFEKTLWVRQDRADGHQKWIHPVTKVVIEYVARKTDIDPGAVSNIRDQLQDHVNILGNRIFSFQTHNWKSEPDYPAAARRFALITE